MLSIIVPIYNVRQYVHQCIDSILNQDYKDLEIVLVDDGSTDGCSEICDEYLSKDERVHVVHKANGGLVSARKAGVLASHGEYIAFVDGDDWIESDMYSSMYSIVMECGCDCVFSGYYVNEVDKQSEAYHSFEQGLYKEEELRYLCNHIFNDDDFFEWGIFPSLCDLIVTRDLLENIIYQEDESIVIGEDAGIVTYLLLNASSVYILHKCLYHYRQREGSLVHVTKNSHKERVQMIALNRFVMKYLGENEVMIKKWRAYMLFLMFQRADYLYPGIDNMEYLFPFKNIKKGTDVIVYGAGVYGKRLYSFLTRTGFCNVCGWVDRNAEALKKQGYDVVTPEFLNNHSCKDIVLALSFAHVRKGVYKALTEAYPERRIHMIDVDEIFSEKTAKAFGLD